MATITATIPHPIYLAGRWVESPHVLAVENPARPGEPAGATYLATPEQYEEAVQAAQRAFESTRRLPAYERGRALRLEADRFASAALTIGADEDEVKPEASFVDDLNADSLDLVELIMSLEEEFGTEISDEDAEKIRTVQDAVDYIDERST